MNNVPKEDRDNFTKKYVRKAKEYESMAKAVKTLHKRAGHEQDKSVWYSEYIKQKKGENRNKKKEAGLGYVKEDIINKSVAGKIPMKSIKPVKDKRKKAAPKKQPALEEGLNLACLARLEARREAAKNDQEQKATRTRKKKEIVDLGATSPKKNTKKATKPRVRKPTAEKVVANIGANGSKSRKGTGKENTPTTANR